MRRLSDAILADFGVLEPGGAERSRAARQLIIGSTDPIERRFSFITDPALRRFVLTQARKHHDNAN